MLLNKINKHMKEIKFYKQKLKITKETEYKGEIQTKPKKRKIEVSKVIRTFFFQDNSLCDVCSL